MRSELVLMGIVATVACGHGASVDRSAEVAKRPPGMAYKGPAFTFHKIRDGIYHAVGTGALVVGSNAAIIEGDHDVLVVDSHATPAAAWALREELSAITQKPIRYVVNTHHHFDHVYGNQIYGPAVEIIGHERTRAAIVTGTSKDSIGYKLWVGGLPDEIRALEQKLAVTTDDARASIAADLDLDRNFLEGIEAVTPTPPTMTFTQTLTLHRGSREIRIMYLGRGHTDGDVIVYLPAERVVITGDLLEEDTAYLGDAFFVDWVETLEQLKKLDFDTVLPGHGQAFKGKSKIDHWQAYLRDFWAQAQAFHHAGISAVEAAKLVDLRAHSVNYPSITGLGIDPNHGMLRAYELLDAIHQ